MIFDHHSPLRSLVGLLIALAVVLLAGCAVPATPTPMTAWPTSTPPPTPTPSWSTPPPTPTPTPTPTPATTPTSAPTYTPTPITPTPTPIPEETGRRYWTDLNCTGSMEPTITCGDLGLVEPDFTQEDIQIGSIIIFKGRCKYQPLRVVHRVIDVYPAYVTNTGVDLPRRFQTQGDGNFHPDSCAVWPKSITGILIGVMRSGEFIEL